MAVDVKNNIIASGSKDYRIFIVDIEENNRAVSASRKHSEAIDSIGRYDIHSGAVVKSLVVSPNSVDFALTRFGFPHVLNDFFVFYLPFKILVEQ